MWVSLEKEINIRLRGLQSSQASSVYRMVLQARPGGHQATGKTVGEGRSQVLLSCGKNDRGSN